MPGTHIPKVKKDPRPHRTAHKMALAARRENELKPFPVNPQDMTLVEYRLKYGGLKDLSEVRVMKAKDTAHWNDVNTWTGATWSAREREMDARTLSRARHVERYQPIQTLDGLDPHWQRKFSREVAASVEAWRAQMAVAKWAP